MPKLGRATIASGLGAVAYGVALIAVDLVIAWRYGTSEQAAIYQAAYLLPTTLIAILSGGAILSAFVPAFMSLTAREPLDAPRFLRSSVSVVALIILLAIFLLAATSHALTEHLGAGFSGDGRRQLAHVIQVMIVMVLPHGIAYIYISALLAKGRVAVANFAPLLVPLAALITAPWWNATDASVRIAAGYVTGSILLALLTGLALKRIGHPVLPALPTWKSGSIGFLKAYAMAATVNALMSGLLFANQLNAGRASSESLAVFTYATKLVLLGLAFFTTVANSVALPYFFDVIQKSSLQTAWIGIRRLLLRSFLAASAVTMAWWLLSPTIVQIFYARGNFTPSDVVAVVQTQRLFILQVPFYVVGMLGWRVLNALGSNRTALAAASLALTIDLVLLYHFSNALDAAATALVHSAAILAWSGGMYLALRFRFGIRRDENSPMSERTL